VSGINPAIADGLINEIEAWYAANGVVYSKGKQKKTPIPKGLRDGDKVKNPRTHPDEFVKGKDGEYKHKKTGWRFRPDRNEHGGPHFDASPPGGKHGNYHNVFLDGVVR